MPSSLMTARTRVHRLRRDLRCCEHRADLFGRQEAGLLAPSDERPDLVDLRLPREGARLGRYDDCRGDLLGCGHKAPIPRSRCERAVCSSRISSVNSALYLSGSSTGFMRCRRGLSSAILRVTACSCTRASTAPRVALVRLAVAAQALDGQHRDEGPDLVVRTSLQQRGDPRLAPGRRGGAPAARITWCTARSPSCVNTSSSRVS